METHTCREGRLVRREQRLGLAQLPRVTGPSAPSEVGRGTDRVCPRTQGGSMALPTPWFSCLVPRSVRQYVCVVSSHPGLRCFESCLLSFFWLWFPDCGPPGSSVCGISQTRILGWVATSSPEDLPNSGVEPTSPAWQAESLPLSHLGSPLC